MQLKEYLRTLELRLDADSDDPATMVQQLACLAGIRLSNKGSLPASCGRGPNLDMDVVQAGILAGLEKIRKYDGVTGNIRAYLYPRIAGEIQNYAWKRENRVADGIWSDIYEVYAADSYEQPGDEDAAPHRMPSNMMVPSFEEMYVEAERIKEKVNTKEKLISLVFKSLSKEEQEIFQTAAVMGNNKPLRLAWGEQLGLSPSGLKRKISYVREKVNKLMGYAKNTDLL